MISNNKSTKPNQTKPSQASQPTSKTIKQTNQQTNKQTNKQTKKQANKQTNKKTRKQPNKQAKKPANKHVRKQANKQTNKKTNTSQRGSALEQHFATYKGATLATTECRQRHTKQSMQAQSCHKRRNMICKTPKSKAMTSHDQISRAVTGEICFRGAGTAPRARRDVAPGLHALDWARTAQGSHARKPRAARPPYATRGLARKQTDELFLGMPTLHPGKAHA